MSSNRTAGELFSPRRRIIYILLLGALTALGPFTIDLYLPAFPVLKSEFSTTEAMIQLTLTGTMLGFAFGQLIMGPISDKIGRKVPLLSATLINVMASIGVVLSQTVEILSLMRLLQGFGAASAAVVATAIVRDLFDGKAMVTMLSRLSLVNGLAPILAPVVGSQLLRIMSWRGIFIFLAVYGVLLIVMVLLFLIESHKPSVEEKKVSMVRRFRVVFKDRIFIGSMLLGAFSFSGLFVYLSLSSFLFQTEYGFSAQQYGYIFALNSIGVVSGVQIGAYYVKKYGAQWVLVISTIMQCFSSILMITFASQKSEIIIISLLYFYIMACGLTFPSVSALGLSRHKKEAGTAASLLGFSGAAIAGLYAPLAGLLPFSVSISMGVAMLIAAILAVLSLWFVIQPKTVPPLD